MTAGANGFRSALTRFVGRAEDVEMLSGLLTRHRLVTVTGPGGVGKTRLVAEVVRRQGDRLPGSVTLVELAAVTQPDLVPAAVAAAVGLQQRTDRSVTQALGELLERGHALLVLDNCEHLVAAVAELCGSLLGLSEDVRILATSREPLGVPGEARLRLRPLVLGVSSAALRADTDTGTDTGTGTDADTGAVALFVDRVRLVDPAFRPTADSFDLVRRIVARLDGLPLAIELAAARYESLGLPQLLRRLDEPLGVLAGGARTAPRRHRSLRETVEWSYRLLDEPHRQAFRRIAIFPGPFTLTAARAVGGVERALLDLVDYSLLAPPLPGPDGRERYRMLQGVRAYALEQLSTADERDDTERAMVDYCLSAADGGAHAIHTSGREVAAASWFDAEDASLQQALSWALDRHRGGALRLASALSGWWQLRGRAVDGYRLLREASNGSDSRDDRWLTAEMWLGRLAQSTAQFHLALHHFTAVCDILGSDAPGRALVDGLACRSGTLRNLARLDEADKGARLALELAEQLGYAEGEAFALTQLSLAAGYAGDHGRAMGYAVQAGRVDRSALPDRLSRRVALVLTIAYINAGDLEPAWQTCVEGLRLARVAGDIHGQADFLQSATSVALQKGAYADAGAHIRESLRLTDVSGDRLRLLGCLHDCAQLCAATGRFADAVTLRGAEEAQAAALDLPIPSSGWSSWSAGAASSTRHLGARRVGEARRRGAAMSLQTATEFASMLAAGAGSDSSDGTPDAVLTPRERAVIALVARGRTDAQIAAELFISIRTVRSHLDRIRDKTGSRRRPDLTRFALREGLA